MKKFYAIAALFLFLAIPWHASQAFDIKVDDSVQLNKEEIADGNVYASCSSMKIDGMVTGDVIAVCKTIVVNGVINGDLIAVSDDVTINGEVKGSVRVAGSNLNVNGVIDHNINVLGTKISLNPNSTVGWDVLVAGVNGTFGGNINGNLHGYMTSAIVSGKIGKNINLRIDDTKADANQGGLLITKDAVVGGNLTYSARKEVRLESPSSITGPVVRQEIKNDQNKPLNILYGLFYELSSLLLIGLILISLKKKIAPLVADNLEKKNWQSALIGLAVLFLTPFISLFLILTIVGIPLALILLAIYLVLLILAIIFAAFTIGRLLLKVIYKKSTNIFLMLIIGLGVFVILTAIPYFSLVTYLIFITYGLGGFMLTIKNNLYD